MTIRTLSLLASSIALCMSLAACEQQSTNQTTTASATVRTPSTPFKIENILIGKAVEVGQTPPKPQTPDDPIEVSVASVGTIQGAALMAKLIALKNGEQAAISTQSLTTDGPTTTAIVFKPDPVWEAGRYLVEVTVDGKLAGQRDVDVFEMPSEETSPVKEPVSK